MLVKYWQAALLAAMMALAGNAAQAQEVWPQGGFATGYAPPAICCKQAKCCDAKDCCKDGACCKKKDGCKDCSCCKDKEDCKKCACGKGKDCCKNCECCKGKDCSCCKDKDCCKNCECCKGKDCACCKSKECCKESCKCCCAAKSKEAKKTVSSLIVVVMPGPMTPMMPVCTAGTLPPAYAFHHVPAASNGFAVVPHPLPPPPPVLTPPGLPVPTMVSPVMPPQTVGVPPPPPPPPTAYCPCPPAGSPVCATPNCPFLTKIGTNDGSSLENYLSILGLVSDLCCAHLHSTSLPSMCLSSLGMLIDLCPQSGEAVPPAGEPAEREVTLLPPPRPEGAPCMPANAVLPLPMMPCAIATPKPAAPAALKVRIVAQPYSDQLEMCVGDDTSVSCKKMTLTLGDNEILLTRYDGRVRVRGEELKAKADCVRTDRKDRLILEGNAQLRYHTDDQHASIHAECIELNLATGSVTIKPAEPAGSYAPERVSGGNAPYCVP